MLPVFVGNMRKMQCATGAWIGALCRQHALPLLSRDRHFDLIKGLHRLDW